MAHPQHTPSLSHLEEVVTALFCLIDDAYRLLNPHLRRYESLKRLSSSMAIALALLQQLHGEAAAWRASARSCATPAKLGSSLSCSPVWWGFIFPRCTAG
jgi:hypothetical protein